MKDGFTPDEYLDGISREGDVTFSQVELQSRHSSKRSLFHGRGILKRLTSPSAFTCHPPSSAPLCREFMASYRHPGNWAQKKTRALSVSSRFIANILLRASVIRHVTSSNQERQFREDKVDDSFSFVPREEARGVKEEKDSFRKFIWCEDSRTQHLLMFCETSGYKI